MSFKNKLYSITESTPGIKLGLNQNPTGLLIEHPHYKKKKEDLFQLTLFEGFNPLI